jgi:hypothetical protein
MKASAGSLTAVVYYRIILGAVVFSRRGVRSSMGRRRVSEDWVTALPRDKNQVFETVVRRWECTYAMMSVALDDALTLRARGELVCARQQVSVAADLLERLALSLVSFCNSVSVRGRRIVDLPVVEPLNVEFFRGDTAQSAASWNGIVHHILFYGRSRFFRKLRILSATLVQVEREFLEQAQDVSRGLAVDPGDCWKKLEYLHYDFNTCLRETEVMLKSFLRTLPVDQVVDFASDLDAPPKPKQIGLKPRLSRAPA